MAIWRQYRYDDIRSSIWSNRYVFDEGWGDAELVETGLGDAYDPQVAVDSAGNAVAVWIQNQYEDSDNNTVYSNRYVVGMGWGDDHIIGTSAGATIRPQVAVDGSGNALAVWSAGGSIYSNRYVVGTDWGTPELLETADASAFHPHVAIERSGNAIAVWTQYTNYSVNVSVYSNRYIVGTGWGDAELVGGDHPGDSASPQVAVDDSGNAMVVWYEYRLGCLSIYGDVWVNRYVAPDTATESQTLLPVMALGAIAVLAVVVSVILLTLRKRTADESDKSEKGGTPPQTPQS